MNTLKPLLVVAVLAGIGYGVYVRLNRGRDLPPPDVAEGWDATPNIQFTDGAGPSAAPSWSSPAGASGGGGMAPSFGPTATPPPAGPRASEAPAYQPANSFSAQLPAGPEFGRNDFDMSIPSTPPVMSGSSGTNGSQAPAFGGSGPQDSSAPRVGDPYAVGTPGSPASGASDRYAPGANDLYAPPERSMPSAADRYTPPTAETYTPPTADSYAPPTGSSADAWQSPPPYEPGRPNDPPRSQDSWGTAPSASSPGHDPGQTFAAALESAQSKLDSGQLAAALRHLTAWHDDPRLTPTEQQRLNQLLDQIAGTVVYSTQHLLEPPYEVQPGERLEEIAQKYEVPWQLLAKINGVSDPHALRAGERLKVIRGPFNAVVSLERRQLTLMVGGAYAGRFAIGLGREHPPREGTFSVAEKIVDPVYQGADRVVGGGDPNNPFGQRWIGLGGDLGIHGTNRPDNIGRSDLAGSISLSPRDVDDLFDILSVGSRVTIRR